METSNCELNNITYKLFPYKFQLQSQNLVVFGSFCLNIKKKSTVKVRKGTFHPLNRVNYFDTHGLGLLSPTLRCVFRHAHFISRVALTVSYQDCATRGDG